MTEAESTQRIDRIAAEAFALLGTGRQIAPFSSRYPNFNLSEAYDVAMRICDLRRARGEIPIGRKNWLHQHYRLEGIRHLWPDLVLHVR